MVTLDDFLNEKKYINKTRKEYTMNDLPYEIRRDPKKFVEEAKKKNLNENQRKLIELIEEGAKLKVKKGKKKETKVILEPYSPYLLLQLQKSLKRGKWNIIYGGW